ACMAAPMTMSLTASAQTSATLTVPDGISAESIRNIKAYQIFTGDYIPATTDSNNSITTPAKLTVTGWGNGINVEEFINALKADATFSGAFASVTAENSAASAQAVSDIIGAWNNDSPMAQAFAKLAVLNKTETGTSGTFSGGSVQFGNDTNNIENGYYVVTCDATAISGTGESGNPSYITNYDSMSLGMLTVIGKDASLLQVGTGTAKVGLPEVMKKVKENTKTVSGTATIGSFIEDDTTNGIWNDVADYCIGDSVPFKLYGTMPQDIANYNHYYYSFTDTLGKEFNAPTSVTIKVNNTAITTAPTNSEIFTSIKEDSEGNTVITVSFEDIKEVIKQALNRDVLASDVITVEYNAVLNSNAKIGLPGQENKVDLTYSNNPNIAYKPSNNDENSDDTPGTPKTPDTPGTPETPDTPGKPGDNTGKTPEDKVIVFTYEADFTKVDGVTKNPLANVEFKLKNADGKYVIVDTAGKVTGWATESTDGSKLVSDSKGQFKVIGLDDGTYTLVETKPLNGYNPIEDTTVVISGETVNNQEWNGEASSALTSFKYTVGNSGEKTGTVDEGIAQGTIENKKGSSLPSTGGIGTTLFYVGGGAMVAVAGVFLITKKRMGKKED
ncbi:MAG: isopeptide-forming domain-containing fimbrial protein, partial [Oscillospiraceae bacterium]|nr:isopeptide-forming domain-containing fimbrial protein [Oscillospiraceae bacterium]